MEIVWNHSEVSAAFHPKTDGQTNVVNCSLGELLRRVVGEKQSTWNLALSLVDFAYNNAVNRSTGKSHFEILHGYSPRSLARLIPPPLDT